MTFDELISIVTDSSPEDWHRVHRSGGPLFLYEVAPITAGDDRLVDMSYERHECLAVYRPDVAISLAWGLSHNRDFKEDWAVKFPDPHASSDYLDIRLNSQIVFRDILVAVDGGRCCLPLPRGTSRRDVPEKWYHLAKLIHGLERAAVDFDEYFQRAGLKITEDRWPELVLDQSPPSQDNKVH